MKVPAKGVGGLKRATWYNVYLFNERVIRPVSIDFHHINHSKSSWCFQDPVSPPHQECAQGLREGEEEEGTPPSEGRGAGHD